MERMRFGIPAVLAVLLCVAAAGQERTVESRVDEYIRGRMSHYGIPGLSVAVVNDGRIAHLKAYGRANLEFEVDATPATVYQIYSVTKIFAGIAAMTLVEDGTLRLETPVTEIVREAPSTWRPITMRHLLTHTSGLPELADNPRYGALSQEQRDALTPSDMLAIAAEAPLRSAAGTKTAYHRFAYTLIGLIVERLSGRTFDAFLAERVFTPYGMNGTRFGDATVFVPRRATAYNREGGSLKLALYRFGFGNPGAGLNSSVADLAALMSAIQQGRVLTRSSLDAMWTPMTLADGTVQTFGLGWTVGTHGNRTVVGYEGGGAAWVDHYPAERLSVVVLCNLNGARADEIPRGVAELFF